MKKKVAAVILLIFVLPSVFCLRYDLNLYSQMVKIRDPITYSDVIAKFGKPTEESKQEGRSYLNYRFGDSSESEKSLYLKFESDGNLSELYELAFNSKKWIFLYDNIYYFRAEKYKRTHEMLEEMKKLQKGVSCSYVIGKYGDFDRAFGTRPIVGYCFEDCVLVLDFSGYDRYIVRMWIEDYNRHIVQRLIE